VSSEWRFLAFSSRFGGREVVQGPSMGFESASGATSSETSVSVGQFRQPRRVATQGGGIASRAIRSRIAANNRRGTATSANWNVTYCACRTTFAPVFTSFS